MKLKFVLPASTAPLKPIPSLGLGSLTASLNFDDEIIVTADQGQPTTWDDTDLAIVIMDSTSALNLAEFYRIAGTHVVLIGATADLLAEPAKPHQSVFLGPARELWPAFLRDFRRGEPGDCYLSEFSLDDLEFSLETIHAA